MKIDDIRCDVCWVSKGNAAGWWQVENINGYWRLSPLTDAAVAVTASHVCPKSTCAMTLLQLWLEKQAEGGK